MAWRLTKDPLYRGDVADGVQLPVPSADPSIVRHILYLDGLGRATPYISTSEERSVASRFAGSDGSVYETRVRHWRPEGVGHIARKEPLQNLRGE